MHISGGFAHSSHTLKYHAGLGIWFCAVCGHFASEHLAKLGKECAPQEGSRRDYLINIAKGKWPKPFSRAEKAKRVAAGKPV